MELITTEVRSFHLVAQTVAELGPAVHNLCGAESSSTTKINIMKGEISETKKRLQEVSQELMTQKQMLDQQRTINANLQEKKTTIWRRKLKEWR